MLEKIISIFKNERFQSYFLVFLVTVLTYALFIPQLGYYRDDWYVLWSGQARGAESLISLFATDRPYMGYTYSLTYRLLGDQMLNWHYYALVWRIIGGLAFLWITRLVWPQRKRLTTLMAILFVVYPGFLSIPDANTKQNQLFSFASAMLSIAFMLQAIKTKPKAGKALFWVLSIAFTANYLFLYEYMIGLEGMRLLLLGYVLYQSGDKDTRKLIVQVAKRWWPYLITIGVFLYWRIFVFVGDRVATDVGRLTGDYLSNPLYMATRLAVESGKDFLDTSVLAWFVMPYKLISRSDYSDLGTALLISLGVVGSVILFEYLRKDRTPQQEEDSDPVFAKQLIVIGALLLVFAILPVVFSGREVDLYDSYKSYGLHVIGGVVMLILGLLDYLKPNFRKVVFYSLLVLAVSTQILNTFEWRGLWQAQRDVWWQLSWRAPGLEENTALFVQLPGGFALEQDYESWGPANLIYAPHEDRLFVQSEVLNDEMAMNILNGTKKTARVRDVSFPLNFRNALILSTPSLSACLHVIDGNMPFYSESERALVKLVGENSNISRVIPTGDSPIPPEAIFGAEPEHTWCYYYQKAALAKQTGNWEEVIQIYQTAEELGFEPKDRVEWMPLIEAYVNLGKLEETQALIERIRTKRSFELSICSQLSQPLYTQLPEYDFIYTNFCEWEE